MPTYHYQCEQVECDADFEEVQKITDMPLKRCPKCGRESLIRIINMAPAGGVRISGEGVYKPTSKVE